MLFFFFQNIFSLKCVIIFSLILDIFYSFQDKKVNEDEKDDKGESKTEPEKAEYVSMLTVVNLLIKIMALFRSEAHWNQWELILNKCHRTRMQISNFICYACTVVVVAWATLHRIQHSGWFRNNCNNCNLCFF